MENNPRQYFGPKDIEMIGRILDKNGMIDGKSPFNDARLASAKSLIKAFQSGIVTEFDLTAVLEGAEGEKTTGLTDASGAGEAVAGYRYGRRVETNGTWTIYHVFSGVPATYGQWKMVDLGVKTAERALKILNDPGSSRPAASETPGQPS